MPELLLVHFDAEEAESWAETLAEAGWEVGIESSNGGSAYRHVRDDGPDVVVVGLREKADWGVEAAMTVRRSRWGHEVPFVFVGGDDDDALLTLREEFPEATYIESEELVAAVAAHGAH